MAQWTVFDHDLGQNDNIFVYIIGRYYSVDNTWIVNQEPYSITWTTSDENSIIVYRIADDYYYDEARVLIWKIEDSNQLY